MKLVSIEEIPVYEGIVIPPDGYGIYGERARVVKLDDLLALPDMNCYTCEYRGYEICGGRCKCVFFGEIMYLNDYCTKWHGKS